MRAYIGPLTAQLERETIRAERAERQLEDSRRRIDELYTALRRAARYRDRAAGAVVAKVVPVTVL